MSRLERFASALPLALWLTTSCAPAEPTRSTARQSSPCAPAAPSLLAQQREMAAEINLARTNPRRYADFVEQHLGTVRSDGTYRRGQAIVWTTEGRAAVDEAIAFLKSATPVPPLTLNSCLSVASQDHVAEQAASGSTGHGSADGSGPSDRASRRLGIRVFCGENLSYGEDSARAVVIGLLVDDGVPSRGHRKIIFRANYRSLGVGLGAHPVYRTMTAQLFCPNNLAEG